MRVFFLEGNLPRAHLERAAKEVLADAVMDRYAIDGRLAGVAPAGARPVTVTRKTGVTDPEAESARTTLAALGIRVGRVKTARTYWVSGVATGAAGGPPGRDPLLAAAARTLGNEAIEEVVLGTIDAWRFPEPAAVKVVRREIPIRDRSPEELAELSSDLHLSLSLIEMATIREHFRGLGREPTDLELETLAQTWSEHCKHKTLTGAVDYEDAHGRRRIENLLKSTIFERDAAGSPSPGASRVFTRQRRRHRVRRRGRRLHQGRDAQPPQRHRALRRRRHGHRRRDPRHPRHGPRRAAGRQHRRLLLRPARPAARARAQGLPPPAPPDEGRRRRRARLRQPHGHPDGQRRDPLRSRATSATRSSSAARVGLIPRTRIDEGGAARAT